MAFRVPKKIFDEQKYDGNKQSMREIVKSGRPVGLIGTIDGEPIGWVAMAPREAYWRIEHSRAYKRLDEKPVWSITCFFVK